MLILYIDATDPLIAKDTNKVRIVLESIFPATVRQ